MRTLLLALLLGNLTGCSSFWGNSAEQLIPPAPLKTMAQSFPVRVLWDRKVGDGAEKDFIRLRPAVISNRLYAVSRDGTIIAIHARTGEILWSRKTQLGITAGVGVHEDQFLLVGTKKGTVAALNTTTGEEIWRAQVSSEVLAAPQSNGLLVVVRAADGTLTGLDARTGERRWMYATTPPALEVRGNAAPLLTRDFALVGLDTGKLLALSLEKGAPLTEKNIATPHGRTDIERLSDMDAELRLLGDTLYASAYRGKVAAMNMRTGELLWNSPISSYAGLDVDMQRVYVSEETDAVVALDRRTGGVLWRQLDLTGRRLSAPVVSGEHIIVGDFEGYVHWLDKETGTIKGRARAARDAVLATPLVVDDIVFAQGQDGMISALRIGE